MTRGADDRFQEAAVLVPAYRDDDGRVILVLVRRAEGGVHGGQIAFPGGRREPGEALLDTALRESHEEIGLERARVELLEELPTVHTLGSGYRISPFLCRIRRPEAWRPCEREIAAMVEMRLDDLVPPSVHIEAVADAPTEEERWPHYRVGPHLLWGATYRIIRRLLPRLQAGEWEF